MNHPLRLAAFNLRQSALYLRPCHLRMDHIGEGNGRGEGLRVVDARRVDKPRRPWNLGKLPRRIIDGDFRTGPIDNRPWHNHPVSKRVNHPVGVEHLFEEP